jgi:hypothetical protein
MLNGTDTRPPHLKSCSDARSLFQAEVEKYVTRPEPPAAALCRIYASWRGVVKGTSRARSLSAYSAARHVTRTAPCRIDA